MTLREKHLLVKRSTIPDAGKGLFTKIFIPKGVRIVEYKGSISTWEAVDHAVFSLWFIGVLSIS